MKKIRGILLHICVICSFACMIANILDWYNPYMDFSGHMFFAQITLYAAVIILALTRTQVKKTGVGEKIQALR